MFTKKTHRMVKEPRISARYLSDFMAASERGRRSIVRGCKYQPIARLVQHNEAKSTVSNFLRDGEDDTATLTQKALTLRNMMADSDFDRDLLDHNADYIDRFASIYPDLVLPKADFLPPGKAPAINLNGVKVTTDLQFRLRRLTKTNKIRVGGAAFRYAKGKPLAAEVACWQSAFMLGYLHATGTEPEAEAEGQLCITIDAVGGVCHRAPTDAQSRFNNMEAACATISEWWPAITPPDGAIFD